MSTPAPCRARVFAPWLPAIVSSRARITATRRAAAALAAMVLGACGDQEPSTLWQLSPAAGIRSAVYDSVGTVGDLRRHGNHGLGTAAHLNGEMVAVDGVFYRVDTSGVAIAVADSQPVTFGIVTDWRGGTPITVEPGLRYCFGCDSVTAGDTTFQTSMNGKLGERFGTTNWFYSLRLEGPFIRVVTRTFAEQKGDPCWNSVLATELRDTFTNVSGTMVGFYEPAFANGTSIAGYHLHFITPSAPAGAGPASGGGDSLYGGHVVSFTTGERVRLQAAPVRHFELEVPSIDEYKRADLSGACTPDSQNVAARRRASASPPDSPTLNRPASANAPSSPAGPALPRQLASLRRRRPGRYGRLRLPL